MTTTSSPHGGSIFAYELDGILRRHQHALGDLQRAPISLEHKKVGALEDSLRSQRRMPGLNQGEIMSIVLMLKLSDDERLQIYAALIALGVQRLLLTYLSRERSWEVAQEVRVAALAWLRREHAAGRDPFRRFPGASTQTPESAAEQAQDQLAEALGGYDEGTALAALGMSSEDGEAGRVFVEQALLCFQRSALALDRLPAAVRATDDWAYWRGEAQKALDEAHDELE